LLSLLSLKNLRVLSLRMEGRLKHLRLLCLRMEGRLKHLRLLRLRMNLSMLGQNHLALAILRVTGPLSLRLEGRVLLLLMMKMRLLIMQIQLLRIQIRLLRKNLRGLRRRRPCPSQPKQRSWRCRTP